MPAVSSSAESAAPSPLEGSGVSSSVQSLADGMNSQTDSGTQTFLFTEVDQFTYSESGNGSHSLIATGSSAAEQYYSVL